MATSPVAEVISRGSTTVLQSQGEGAAIEATDARLLEDYLDANDEAALAALVRRHGPMVWGVCRRVLASHHDAEDAFQATFLVLVRKAASIHPREKVANWLHGVAHQTALKARATRSIRNGRERQGGEMPESGAMQSQSLASGEPKLGTAQWVVHWGEVRAVLDDEVSRLPDNYRAAVIHCDLKGETRKVAARNLGVPEGTVAGWLARARAMLAARLAQRGITPLSAGMLVAVLSQNGASAASVAVPTLLTAKTIQAASVFAAGQAASSAAIAVPLAALTEGVMKTMMMSKLKSALSVGLYLGGLAGAAIFLNCCPAEAQEGTERRTSPSQKRSERLSPLTREGSDRLSPLTREGSDRLAPLTREGSERLTPLTRERSDRLTPLTRVGSDRLIPSSREEAPKLTPPVREGKERLTPSDAKPKKKEMSLDKEKIQGMWRIITAEVDGVRYGEGREEMKEDRLVIEKSTFTFSSKERSLLTDPAPIEIVATFELENSQSPGSMVFRWKKSSNGKAVPFAQKAIYELQGDTLRICINSGAMETEVPTDFSANKGSKRACWTFKRTHASNNKDARSSLGERVTEPAWQLGERLTAPARQLGERVTEPAWQLGERLTAPARQLGERVTEPVWQLGERLTVPAPK